MKKHPKQAFGIFHDGLALRMVHLVRDGSDVYLQAVDHADLDKYWYKTLDEPIETGVDLDTKEISVSVDDAIDMEVLDSDYASEYQVQPGDRMLNAFELSRGVIAINVYEDNILKDAPGIIDKKGVNRFIKTKVPLKEQKAGDYHSSIVEIGGVKRHWLHHGTNHLLEMLQEHSRNNRRKLFFQLADANDIAITDYFVHAYRDELEGRVMLVYLGQEYRKAFVFEQGKWQETLKLQITQNIPDEEIITSKLVLAIDSAGISEPQRIILCGDLASSTLVEFMTSQFNSVQIELFNFHNIILSAATAEVEDTRSLSKYAISIALAYKALFMEENGFSPSNFLPSKIIEGQKEFKIAWHGLLILLLIFASVILATNAFLKQNQTLGNEQRLKTELNLTLKQKQAEADKINEILSDMERLDKNLEALGTLLSGKNYWTELLDIINTSFRAHPTSWLTNLKQEKEMLFISGVSSKRDNVIAFANELPGSRIHKVAHTTIRNHDIWSFELSFTAPNVDWMAEIEQQMRSSLAAGTLQSAAPDAKTPKSVVPAQSVPRSAPASSVPSEKVKTQKLHLPPLDEGVCPVATAEMLALDVEVNVQYEKFASATKLGNMWEYRKQGFRFLSLYAAHPLAPVVRWWMAYRLYLDQEYDLAGQFLAENLNASSEFHDISLLLQARIYLAQGDRKYIDLYDSLQRESQDTALAKQVVKDLKAIAQGGRS